MKRLFLLLLFFLGIISISTAQNRWYVDSSGSSTGTGVSWMTACSDLQLVINNASAGDTIWVAKGTYKPLRRADNLGTISLNDRNNAFVLKVNVHIYGGFASSETFLSQRNWDNNPTILSGDIGIPNDSTDNCYHVVISAGDTTAAGTLDGFTITAGNANGGHAIIVNARSIGKSNGGGIHNDFSSPTLTNIVISNNIANGWGGGMCNHDSSSPVLINITISNNTAVKRGGGGMSNHYSSSPMLIDVIISNNTADIGGGMSNVNILTDFSSLVLTNVTICNNTAANGGGIYNTSDSSSYLKIRNSIIWGNTLSNGITPDNVYSSVDSNVNLLYQNSLIGGATIGNGIILGSVSKSMLIYTNP